MYDVPAKVYARISVIFYPNLMYEFDQDVIIQSPKPEVWIQASVYRASIDFAAAISLAVQNKIFRMIARFIACPRDVVQDGNRAFFQNSEKTLDLARLIDEL